MASWSFLVFLMAVKFPPGEDLEAEKLRMEKK